MGGQSSHPCQAFQRVLQITINTETPIQDFVGTEYFAFVQTGIDREEIFCRHPPEGQLDDAGRVEADAQLQKKLQAGAIAGGGLTAGIALPVRYSRLMRLPGRYPREKSRPRFD